MPVAKKKAVPKKKAAPKKVAAKKKAVPKKKAAPKKVVAKKKVVKKKLTLNPNGEVGLADMIGSRLQDISGEVGKIILKLSNGYNIIVSGSGLGIKKEADSSED